MDKEFVPYELALELKQLGFDESCFSYSNSFFKGDIKTHPIKGVVNSSLSLDEVAMPLWQQAFRFLLNKLGDEVNFSIFEDYSGYVGLDNLQRGGTFNKLRQGLELLIKTIKENGKTISDI